MVKILLMGNPNVGKSAVFNRLTGANVIVSNYPGTTVEFTKGIMRIAGQHVELIDVPGTYSLDPTNKAEQIAVEMLKCIKEEDVVINVVEATNLERSLNLTLQLIKQNVPIIIALNFWDETKHKGISIDAGKLENILKVPCVPICAVTGEGVKHLVERIEEAKPSLLEYDEQEKWHEIGNIVDKVQTITHRHHTLLERLSDASVRPLTGLPMAVIVLFLTFKLIRVAAKVAASYLGNKEDEEQAPNPEQQATITSAGSVDTDLDSSTANLRTYTVASGDTLSRISKQFYNDANQWQRIFDANRDILSNPDRILPGQHLRIP